MYGCVSRCNQKEDSGVVDSSQQRARGGERVHEMKNAAGEEREHDANNVYRDCRDAQPVAACARYQADAEHRECDGAAEVRQRTDRVGDSEKGN